MPQIQGVFRPTLAHFTTTDLSNIRDEHGGLWTLQCEQLVLACELRAAQTEWTRSSFLATSPIPRASVWAVGIFALGPRRALLRFIEDKLHGLTSRVAEAREASLQSSASMSWRRRLPTWAAFTRSLPSARALGVRLLLVGPVSWRALHRRHAGRQAGVRECEYLCEEEPRLFHQGPLHFK